MNKRLKKMGILVCCVLFFCTIPANADTAPSPDQWIKALKPCGEIIPSAYVAVPFDSDRYAVLSEAVPWLNALGQAMTDQSLKAYIFEIRGHAGIPDAEQNRQLSLKRAEAVKAYLISNFRLSPDQLIVLEDDPPEPGTEKSGVTVTNTAKKFAAAEDRPFCKIEVKYLRGRKVSLLLPGDTLTSRDDYSIYFTPDRACYIYIFQADSPDDEIKMFFPNPEYSKKTNPVSGGETYRIPERAQNWLHVDKDKGNKELVVLSNSEPLNNPEEICRAVLSGSGISDAGDFLTMRPKGTRKTLPTGEPPEDRSSVIGDTVFTWRLGFNHQ